MYTFNEIGTMKIDQKGVNLHHFELEETATI